VFSGGLDRVVNCWDVSSARSLQAVGNHENAVRCMEWSAASNALVTGGWDSSLRVWDARADQANQQARMTIRTSSRVFAMDVHEHLVACGLQDMSVRTYDMRRADHPIIDRPSSLGHQIRCARLFDRGAGLISGSIEGRVAVENTDPSAPPKRYMFKCHRNSDATIFPVNAISFNPQSSVMFATGGGDGTVCVWDQEAKKRLHALPDFGTSISALEFSRDGKCLVIAASYAHERGDVGHPADQVFIYSTEDELQKKPVEASVGDGAGGGGGEQ
jgi:cell cycle arrest protein BUB3